MLVILSKFLIMDINDPISGKCVAINAQRYDAKEALKIGSERIGSSFVKIYKSFVKQADKDRWSYGFYVERQKAVPVWIVTHMEATPQVWIKPEYIWDEKEVYVMKKD